MSGFSEGPRTNNNTTEVYVVVRIQIFEYEGAKLSLLLQEGITIDRRAITSVFVWQFEVNILAYWDVPLIPLSCSGVPVALKEPCTE